MPETIADGGNSLYVQATRQFLAKNRLLWLSIAQLSRVGLGCELINGIQRVSQKVRERGDKPGAEISA